MARTLYADDRFAVELERTAYALEEYEGTVIMVSHEEQLGARFDRVVRLDEIARAERSIAA